MSATSTANLYLVEVHGGWSWEGNSDTLIYTSLSQSDAIEIAKNHYREKESEYITTFDFFSVVVREVRLGFNDVELVVWNSSRDIEKIELGNIETPDFSNDLNLMWDSSVPLEPSDISFPFYGYQRIMVAENSSIKETIANNHKAIAANDMAQHFYERYEM